MFTLYNVILTTLIVVLCSCASYTDYKYGKVYNTHVFKFLLAGISINIAYLCYAKLGNQIDSQSLIRYVINILIGCGLSYFMYYNKTWAAGDAKLYFTILFLIPYNLIIDSSLNVFPGFILLVFVFSISFIYITFETLIFLFKDIRNKTFEKNHFSLKNVNASLAIGLLRKYLFSYLLSALIIELLVHFTPLFYNSNRGFILLLNIFLISIALNVLSERAISLGLIAFILAYVGMKIFVVPFSINSVYISINSVITLVIVILLRYLGSKYNYFEIPTDSVKSGMVLSFDTILQFKKSKVKGLPEFTTETTDSRITPEHVESIKRWKNSKNGGNVIRIVRHVPFAPFISVGTIMFLFIRIYTNFIR